MKTRALIIMVFGLVGIAAQVSHTVAADSWGPATVISSGAQNADPPQLAMDASGAAIAFWVQGNGFWVNRYVPGTGWGTATQINAGTESVVHSPQVTTDGSGNALAVWSQWDGAQSRAYANLYVQETGWGGPTLIETGEIPAGSIQVYMGTSGNALAVWSRLDGTVWNIYSIHYERQTGWATPTLIETRTRDHTGLQFAMDGSGTAIVVWMEWEEGWSIYAKRYAPDTGWGTANQISAGTGSAHSPQVAMDGSGNALAVWAVTYGLLSDPGGGILARRYVPGTGWEPPHVIWTSSWGGGKPRVAINSNGDAAVVGVTVHHGGWAGDSSDILGSSYVPGKGWETPAHINTWVYWWHDAGAPQVAMSRNGNAVAVWHQEDNLYGPIRRDIHASLYVPGSGWGTADFVEIADGDAMNPQVATDGNGNFVMAWQQWDGMRYNVLAVVPAGGLSVTPSDGLTSSGNQGGSFSPSSMEFTLTNTGDSSIDWSASSTQPWVTLSAMAGALAAGAGTIVTVSINDNAVGLTPGTHSDTVTFTNITNNIGSTTRTVSLTVNALPGTLSVTPSAALSASGMEGGSFSPLDQQYFLTNTGDSSIQWTVSNMQSWVTLSTTGGTLASGEGTTVTVSISDSAADLPPGTYKDTVSFTDTTNDDAITIRAVNLKVNALAGALSVTPATGLVVSGTEGGPFGPLNQQFTLTNTGGSSIDWTASKGQPWVTLSTTGGSLAAGEGTTVTFSINDSATGLAPGTYNDAVTFATDEGSTTRTVNLTVNAAATGADSPSQTPNSSGADSLSLPPSSSGGGGGCFVESLF